MGRFYMGDIEGKFWFAVQSSNDADNFGVLGRDERDGLYYKFKVKDLENIKKGIIKCKSNLGKYEKLLDLFFEKNNAYNDEMISKELNIDLILVKKLLVYYSRLELGIKIKECVMKQGFCRFTAEC